MIMTCAERRDINRHLGQPDRHHAHAHPAAERRVADHAEVHAEGELAGAAEEDGQAERGKDLHQHRTTQHPADDPVARRDAEGGPGTCPAFCATIIFALYSSSFIVRVNRIVSVW